MRKFKYTLDPDNFATTAPVSLKDIREELHNCRMAWVNGWTEGGVVRDTKVIRSIRILEETEKRLGRPDLEKVARQMLRALEHVEAGTPRHRLKWSKRLRAALP